MDTSHYSSLFNYLSSCHSEFKDSISSARLKWLYGTAENRQEDEYIHHLTVNFWRTNILDCNLAGHLGSQHYCLAIDIEKVGDAFYRPDLGKATALDYIVNDLIRTNDLISLETFTNTYTTTSWLGRVYNKVTRTPAQWPPLPYSTTSTVSNTLTNSLPKLYVVMPSIQTIARHILQRYQKYGSHFSSVDSILTFTEFRSDYGLYHGVQLTDADLWLLLRYMTCQYGLGVDPNVRGYGRSHVAIKFPEHNEIVSNNNSNNITNNNVMMDLPTSETVLPTRITESDKAIISLKTTCKALQDQVNKLQLKMESVIKQSLDYSSKQQKSQALYAVKRKLQLEQVLNRRLQSLETMETLLLKIDTSHNDVQIIQAFNVGVASLKQIFNDNDLTVTSVDETMLNMQAALEEHERVEEAMTNGNAQIMEHGNNNIILSNNDKYDKTDRLYQNIDNPSAKRAPLSQEKRTRDDLENDTDAHTIIANANDSTYLPDLPSTMPNSELARLHTIFSSLPQVPSEPPRSKQRRLRQLA